MKNTKLIWTVVLAVAALILLMNSAFRGAGSVYVRSTPIEMVNIGNGDQPLWINSASDEALDYDLSGVPEDQRIRWNRYDSANPSEYAAAVKADPAQTVYQYSFWRSVGVWVAALFTLFILSFLYRDNPFYKVAESVVVGVSAAYWMTVGFWDVIVPNLLGKLLPGMVKNWAMPGLNGHSEWLYLVPLTLGIMLLMRLSPKGAWISRWPLAFIIGTTAGIRLLGFIHADFLSQIRNSIIPLFVSNPVTGFSFWDSFLNLVLVLGVLASLVYFFFSVEHKGLVGKTAKVGIWVLMVTFGAAFGYTVMGRIALLAIRLEFLFDDWLWLIDPTLRRMGL
ncbi:MAG: hypothetical protein ABIA75_00875 [Candidatus Neomarinimicrobiota bacterium]